MILRPYQDSIICQTRAAMNQGFKRPLIVAPTGSGKTVMFSYFTSQAVQKGNRVLILAHREELLDQIGETLSKFKVHHSYIASTRPYDPASMVQVGSVFTVINRLNSIRRPDIIIVDEAHHAATSTTWGRVISHFKTWVIGVTATPTRLSGEPLGDVFDHMILGPTVRELIGQGALCPYKYYAPTTIDMTGVRSQMGDFARGETLKVVDRPSITGSAVSEYRKLLSGKRAAIFCVSVEHSEHVAAQFREAGIPAASLDGKMDRPLRRSLVSRFKSGDIKILTNCSIITEGFDLPAMDGVILLRPTMSLSLFLQMVGRSLRPYENKNHAVILDHVGNIQRHGLPCADREWSLNTGIKPTRKATDSGPPVKICERCFGAQPSGKPSCIYCNHVFESKTRKIDEVDGELKEIDPQALRRKKVIEQARAQSEDELYQIGVARGYKHPRRWAKHVFQSRQAKRIKLS